MMADNKREKRKIPKRSPGLVIQPPAPRPAEENDSLQIFREVKAAESTPLLPPPTTSYQSPSPKSETAPTRDFSRVPNSIARDAVPAGLFKGTSKKTYDALYQRSRGAVVPTREVRARFGDLRTWAGVSHNTLREHLRNLENVGLISRRWELGNNDGVIYEVFIPEELPPSYHPLPPPTTTSLQKLVGPSTQKLVGGGGGQVAVESTTSRNHNTFLNTDEKTDDDEAFAGLLALLKNASEEVTGRKPSAADREGWKEVAELLATELKVAASRTSVSSAPAFLAEHLRRRLRKADARQIEREVSEASSGQAKASAAPQAKPELTPEQVQEQVNLLARMIRDGAEMKELDEQFASDFRPAQWHMVRSMALVQAGVPRRPAKG